MHSLDSRERLLFSFHSSQFQKVNAICTFCLTIEQSNVWIGICSLYYMEREGGSYIKVYVFVYNRDEKYRPRVFKRVCVCVVYTHVHQIYIREIFSNPSIYVDLTCNRENEIKINYLKNAYYWCIDRVLSISQLGFDIV